MKAPRAAALALLFLPALVGAQPVAQTSIRTAPVATALPAPVVPSLSPAGTLAPTLGVPTLSNLSLPAAGVPSAAPRFSADTHAAAVPAAQASAAAVPSAVQAVPAAARAQLRTAPSAEHAASAERAIEERTAPTEAIAASLRGASAELAPARGERVSDEAASSRIGRTFDASRPAPEGLPVAAFARLGDARVPESARLRPGRQTSPDAVPWSEVERVVRFASPEEARSYEKDMKGEFRPHRPGEAAGWQDFLRACFDLMQTAPEGREVLRQLVDEYTRGGRKVTIMPEDFADSTIFHDGEMEDINGTHGMVVPDQYAYYFNSKYLEFENRDLAIQYVAANIAHEFRHLVNQAQVERITPEAAEAFSLAFINEQRARQTGYLVAVRTNKGKATGSTEDARSLAQDPDGYWEGLKAGGYSQYLDIDEMSDPVRAYSSRIALLQEEAASVREQIAQQIPRTRAALEILSTKEGHAAELKNLREEIDTMSKILPEELKEILGTIKELQRMVAVFRSPRARGDLQYLRAAAKSPAFQKLVADYRRDQAALVQLLREKPIPAPVMPKGQSGWERVRALVKQSQREHPQYWAAFWAKFGKE
ncbi:MAG: hypothetical protein WC969_09980 [Elusimicrobiota bacterium]|jgi:hypothetical protein